MEDMMVDNASAINGRSEPHLVAITGNTYNGKIAPLGSRDMAAAAPRHTNYFRSAEWSADGTTLLTTSYDNTFRTFILPPNLLSPPSPPRIHHHLRPYSTHTLPSPPHAATLHPSFTLSYPSTTLFLTSPSSLPIRLVSAVPTNSSSINTSTISSSSSTTISTSNSANPPPQTSPILATYPLTNPHTEAFIAPHSLLFTSTTTFLAGFDSEIALFDINRYGASNGGPVERFPTIPSKRKKIVGGGVGMKGIVSALAVSGSPVAISVGGGGRVGDEGYERLGAQSQILAAGTFTRWIGLYDAMGRGGTIGVFNLGGNEKRNENDGDSVVMGRQESEGRGITQLRWLPGNGGQYLLIAERCSDIIHVWDVRMSGRRLAVLRGRRANTMQRMGIDVLDGDTVAAGGTDGMIRIWEGVGKAEGDLWPAWEWKGHDGE
ncbi:hypothetical protein MMC25_005685 [Agyrium rufum]|nr:hypothetical protein [Agyrium rufum]